MIDPFIPASGREAVGNRSVRQMYAIIENGSHQFRVSEGQTITIDRRDGDPGTEIVFEQVLLVAGNDIFISSRFRPIAAKH